MNKLFFLSLFLSSNIVNISANLFADFVTKYDKRYPTTHEYFKRKQIFKNNLQRIKIHNNEDHSWKMRMNSFGDLQWEEFRTKHLNSWKVPFTINNFFDFAPKPTLPDSHDWVSKGAVTPVKNQAQCGSCWAFSTTGALEGLHFLTTGKLVSLSEQQLVDCSRNYGNNGCNGGLMDLAFKYVEDNGICTEESYPYTAEDGVCHNCSSAFKISGYKDVQSNDEDSLQLAAFSQPVSVAIEADQSGFQFYSHGVFDGECGTELDHGVLLVGWGNLNGSKYWKVKNSWGNSWGLDGYILMARDIDQSHGQCGIAMQPSVPTI
jgi:C1A family cysteine protease